MLPPALRLNELWERSIVDIGTLRLYGTIDDVLMSI
jgi:hypothetical protein